MEIFLLIILVLLSAFFSMAETAMTTVSGPHIISLVEMNRRGAKTLKKLRENPGKLISTILVGNNLVNVSASVMATTIANRFFENLGMRQEGLIIGIVIGFMTLFLLVFGEITPKTMAIKNAEPLALWFAPLMVFFEWILNPIAWFMTQISRPFIFIFGGSNPEKVPFVTEEIIKTLLIAGEKEGIIERDEREMINSIFKFSDLTALNVMTPRERIDYVGKNSCVAEVIAKIKETGHSRLPVIDANLDNIVGVVYAKDLLEADGDEPVFRFLRQALFIPTGKMIGELMAQMQSEYKHLAIIVNEFGHTIGLATLEDLVEEIVGEIHDEYERKK